MTAPTTTQPNDLPMNPEVKALWMAALRSGEYHQAMGSLHYRSEIPGFCCLGVLCDLAVKAGVTDQRAIPNGERTGYRCNNGTYETAYLPDTVLEWAGLTHANPTVADTSLAFENDRRRPFTEIADLIDQYL